MRYRLGGLFVVLVGLGSACAPKAAPSQDEDKQARVDEGPDPTEPEPEVEAPKAAETKLKLGPITLTTGDDPSRTVVLAEDGTVSLGGRDVGVIDPVAGTLGTKEGTVVATLGDEGKVEASGGLPIELSNEGLRVTLPNDRVYAVVFEEEGVVRMRPADGSAPAEGEKAPPPITADGCEGEMRRTCAFLFGTMTFIVGTKKAAG